MADDVPAVGRAVPPTSLRRALVVVCVATNALTAGSMFCYPLIGPSLMADFALDLKQTNVIWSAAVLGEYLSAAAWGALADAYGPAPLSLGACILFGLGYGLMAQRSGFAGPHDVPFGIEPTAWLAICFALVGAGVGASYFGSMTAATRVWPHHPGRALALPLTLFSLSSMFLTAVGERFFVDPSTGDLDSARFLAFLAVLLTVCNGMGAWGFLAAPSVDDQQAKEAHGQGVRHEQHKVRARAAAERSRVAAEQHASSERTPLLHHVEPVPTLDESAAVAVIAPHGLPADIGAIEAGDEQVTASGWSVRSSTSMLTPRSESLADFAKAPSVWILALILLTAVGAGEMVMANAGSMVSALYPSAPFPHAGDRAEVPGMVREELRWRSRAIAWLAVTNTLSRLIAGFLADAVSPARASEDDLEGQNSESTWVGKSKAMLSPIRISRVTLLMLATAGMGVTFAVAAIGLNSLRGLMALAAAVGFLYGSTFTLVPSVVASAFGLSTFGRSWGLLSYACALGSFAFSMLYASFSDAVAGSDKEQPAICRAGRACFSSSFSIAATATLTATLLLTILRARWSKYL